jgi:hypothetical protein
MQTSPFLDEIRAQSRQEGVRATLLRLSTQTFGKSPNKKQQKELEGMTDQARLEELTERLLFVDSWSELLNGRVAQ